MQIYIHRNEQQLGPFTEAEIKSQLATGSISRQDLVWWDGQAGWLPLEQTILAGITASAPPPPPSAVVPAPAAVTPGTVAVPASDRTSVMAIGALVSALASFFLGITFILAIILGHLSLSEIRKNPGMRGRGMAMTGLVLGYAYPVFVVVSVSILLALGAQVRQTFKTINSQLAAAQAVDTNQTAAEVAQPSPATTTNAAPASGQ